LEHMDLNKHAPRIYPLGAFTPCAVIAMDNAGEELIVDNDHVFKESLRIDIKSIMVRDVTVYIRDRH